MLATNAGLLTPILGDPSPWTPQRLYINGEAGAWYDPGDLTAEKVAWRRNLLTWSEQFDNAAWVKTNATVTPNVEVAPDGTTTVDQVVFTTGTKRLVNQIPGAYAAGTPLALSVWARGNVGGEQLRLWTGWSVPSPITLTTTLTRYTVLFSAQGTSNWLYIDGLTDSSTVFIWGAQLEVGSTASAYQRITDFTSDFLAAFPTHALYQDAAGTTPVTALGQPVGLALDKSRGGLANIGPELVTNGDFATNINGWTAQFTSTASWDNGTLRSTSSGTNAGEASAPITCVIGRTYQVTGRIIPNTANGALSASSLAYGAAAGTTGFKSSAGIYSFFFTATATTMYVIAGLNTASAGVFANFDNVSVREVPGVHKIQPTSASREALDARVNLLTYTEQFDNAAWAKTAVTVTANNAAAPDGATTADLITPAASTAYHAVNQNIAMVVGTAYTVLAYFKQTVGGARYGYLLIGGNNKTGVFDTQTGTVTFTSAGISSASMLSVGNGWYLCVMTLTAASGDSNVFMGPTTSATTGNAATAATDTILLWGADVRLATDAAYPYQRVVTATDYADAGVPRSFLHDGFDDSSYTASTLNLSGTDKVTVWAGVYKNSDAARGAVVEHSSSYANAGAFGVLASDGGAANYQFGIGGATGNADYVPTGFAAPISRVLSSEYNLAGASKATTIIPRVNGALAQSGGGGTTVGGGNFQNAVTYFGRRNNASLPFNGKVYCIIIRGGVTDAATLALTERYVGSRMGIVL